MSIIVISASVPTINEPFLGKISKFFAGLLDNNLANFKIDNLPSLTAFNIRGTIVSTPHIPAGIDHILPDFSSDRKSTRLNSSHVAISYAVFCLKKKIQKKT